MQKHIPLYLLFLLIPSLSHSQTQASSDIEFDEILSRDIADFTVTSASRRSQKLKDTAAAVYVITQEDIRRAGIYSIPEALRMVPGIEVAKTASNRWSVTSRGFNGTMANKLLVMIDGRAVYTPVFSGVYWDDQSTSINDIERIEVIRGSGATLYGSNAVNGVISIITKPAEKTQGNMISATTTTNKSGLYEARHGSKIGNNSYYRAYTQYVDGNNWERGRFGFRFDGKTSGNDNYTVQGDAYGGTQSSNNRTITFTAPYSELVPSVDDSHGANIIGRWSRKLSSRSDVTVQAYIDNYARNELGFNQNVSTADIEAQHSVRLNQYNNFVWGGGARIYYENLNGNYNASINDRYSMHNTFNIFAQDEHSIIPNILYLTFGSKFEYNDFTGFEVQPSSRIAWHIDSKQMLWGAVSRAIRTPSNVEKDVNLLGSVSATSPLTEMRLIGNPNQKAEELIAYELGHRIEATKNLTFDSTIFFNDFDSIQTIGSSGAAYTALNGNTIIPYMVNNLGAGYIYGLETAASWNVTNRWKLTGSYSHLKINLREKTGTTPTLGSTEKLSPRNQFAIQSYYNVTERLHWDNMLYYVGDLSGPVDSYIRYDTRIAYLLKPGMEISLIGRNLLGAHEEFPSSPQYKLDRNLLGQVLWKF